MENRDVNVIKDIYNKFDKDPRTKGAVIEVGFNRGIVILSGHVKSAKVFSAAEEIARQQPGVITVTNELKVG